MFVYFVGAVVILYITSQEPQVQLIFKDVVIPIVAQRFSLGPDFSAFPYCSPSCRTRSGCPGGAVASSATGAVLSMNVAVLTQRQVPAALCAGWAPGPFIDLSVGSVSGVFYCDLVVATPLSMMNVEISWAIQTFLCGGSRLPFGSGAISLSGLQIGEKAIQTFLCGGSRLPFGSGAIPFRVCKLAKRRSKRF